MEINNNQVNLKKISIQNFKSIESLDIQIDNHFNIFIGENNVGKSTIFEAITFWYYCYKTLMQKSKLKFYKKTEYLSFKEVNFLRLTGAKDLFKNNRKNIYINLMIEINNNKHALSFQIESPKTKKDLYYRVSKNKKNTGDFDNYEKAVSSLGKKLDEVILIYQAKPIASILTKENYLTKVQISEKIAKGYSHEVLRNKIDSHSSDIGEINKSLTTIFNEKIELKVVSKRSENSCIRINVKRNNSDVELNLQGSGFLQVLEIISTIEFNHAPLKLILVDEPDSHIHASIQNNLISYLRELSDNTFFVITHNDRIVESAKDNEVFFLTNEIKNSGKLIPLKHDDLDLVKNALGGILMPFAKLNSAKIIIFVEGNDDIKYISLLTKKYNEIKNSNLHENVFFFPLRGKDNLLSKLEYNKRILASAFKNKKYGVIFDRDFSTNNLHFDLEKNIKGKGFKYVYAHNGYCVESVLFTDTSILARYLNIEEKTILLRLGEYFNDINDINSSLYNQMSISFDGQIREEKPSDLVTFIKDLSNNEYHRFMNKKMIVKFVEDMSINNLNHDGSEDGICGSLLKGYFAWISKEDDIYDSFKNLFKILNDEVSE